MSRRCVFACVLFALLQTVVVATSHAAPPPRKLKLALGPTYVDVEGATKSGTVLVVGYEQTARDYSRVFRRVEREGVTGSDGSLRIDLGRTLAPRSFWMAIDLATSAYGAMTGDGSKLREGEFLPANFRKDSAGRRREAALRFPYVHALLIRPALGVWESTAGDGGPSDGDGVLDGTIALNVSRFTKRRTKTPDLDEYKPGDLVVVFVPSQMGYVITEVAP